MCYEEVSKIRRDKVSPSLMTYYEKPLLIVRGEKQFLYNEHNRPFLDMIGGIVTVSVGHCHPYVNDALKKQLDTLWHTTSIYMTEPMHEYAQKLTATLPDHLQVCYFVNSGSEANDLALMMARLYTRSYDIITLRNSYHGLTQTLLGATNLANWKQPLPAGFAIHKAMNADPYRGVWGGRFCRDCIVQTDRQCLCDQGECIACDNYVHQFEQLLDYDMAAQASFAALLVEPIQGVGGTVQYPRDYLLRIGRMSAARNALLICDEVQTGFGRLGDAFWGFETHHFLPDIVTMAKGMGNGFPLAAVVTSKEIAQSLTSALHFNTYGGNPLACAVASAVLDVIEEEQLQKNSKEVGSYMMHKLNELKAKSELVGDVRGKGLMIGVELVSNRQKRTPLSKTEMTVIFEKTKDFGLLLGKGGRFGNVLRIKPPMCITKSDVDFAVDVIEKALLP